MGLIKIVNNSNYPEFDKLPFAEQMEAIRKESERINRNQHFIAELFGRMEKEDIRGSLIDRDDGRYVDFKIMVGDIEVNDPEVFIAELFDRLETMYEDGVNRRIKERVEESLREFDNDIHRLKTALFEKWNVPLDDDY